MDELKLAVQLWGTGGIVACIIMLFMITHWRNTAPNLFTEKATPKENRKARMLTSGFLIGMLIYANIGLIIFASICQDTTPWTMYGICSVFIIGAVLFFANIYREK